jgi:hypothetical protein
MIIEWTDDVETERPTERKYIVMKSIAWQRLVKTCFRDNQLEQSVAEQH